MATTRGRWKVKIGGADFCTYNDMVQREPVDGGPVVDEQQQPFGTAMAWFARGNFKGVRAMTVSMEFADAGGSNANKLATDFFETAAQTWNGVADVIITHQDGAGAETSYKITAASVRVVAQQPIGVLVVSKLTITGGPAVLYTP